MSLGLHSHFSAQFYKYKTFTTSLKKGVERESFKSVSGRFHARGAAAARTCPVIDLPSGSLDDQIPPT